VPRSRAAGMRASARSAFQFLRLHRKRKKGDGLLPPVDDPPGLGPAVALELVRDGDHLTRALETPSSAQSPRPAAFFIPLVGELQRAGGGLNLALAVTARGVEIVEHDALAIASKR
jgi:hypothetical protein